MEFSIHEHYPAEIHLDVHLVNGQRIYFTSDNVMQRAMEAPRVTTLMAFFNLCNEDAFAQTLLYNEIMEYYTWQKGQKWQRRKQGSAVPNYQYIKKSDAKGRVYSVHTSHFECFCLRILLHNVRGPKSFEDIRTVMGLHIIHFEKLA